MIEDGLDRTLYIFGEISEESAEKFTEEMLEMVRADPIQEIELIICTGGGCLYSMFAIHDLMRSVNPPICTIGLGKIMSAGTLLLAAGDRRLIFPNSSVMLHEPVSESVEGGIAHFRQESAHFEELYSQMKSLYAEYTGKTFEQISADLHKESGMYLTARKAVEYGLADEIYELRDKAGKLQQKAKTPGKKPSRRK